MKEERIYIVGYMASGKTTFGKALAQRLGWDFVDLDAEVEAGAGKPIGRLMAEEGEETFRRMESSALKHTSTLSKTVIATGGGAPCWRDNMEFMTLHGITVWLVASPARIAERILEAGSTRPLVADVCKEELPEFVTRHLRARQPFYCRAMIRHSGENLENETEIRESVDQFISNHRT